MKSNIIGILLLFACSAGIAADTKPNVLFVLTDDQRADAIGLGGSKYLKTPNIDRLGKEGVYFKNAFCTTSLCSPSRASILSGLYAHKHGVVNNFTEYPASLKSFPIQLQSITFFDFRMHQHREQMLLRRCGPLQLDAMPEKLHGPLLRL